MKLIIQQKPNQETAWKVPFILFLEFENWWLTTNHLGMLAPLRSDAADDGAQVIAGQKFTHSGFNSNVRTKAAN